MLKKGITLRGIEVFEVLAHAGSVAKTATQTGLSQPAVSQQLRNLERALGTDLIDHTKRPMRLTTAGQVFLKHATTALAQLRQAQNEVSVLDLAHLEELDLGIIDDFDDTLTPRLVTVLAENLKNCRFHMVSAGSKELVSAVEQRQLHMAITARTTGPLEGVLEFPLAQDPLMIVRPKTLELDANDLLAGRCHLPLLKYASDQLIAEQVDHMFKDAGIDVQTRFEIGSHQALMAMVARGIGWAITTPMGFMRAARYHRDITGCPLPFTTHPRKIVLMTGASWSSPVTREIAQTMRDLMRNEIVAPALSALPWLSGHFKMLEQEE